MRSEFGKWTGIAVLALALGAGCGSSFDSRDGQSRDDDADDDSAPQDDDSSPGDDDTPIEGYDDDGDGIPNSVEGEGDTDGDTIPDAEDTDSDGDGIPDSQEAGDDPEEPRDSDGDSVPDYLDLDSDGNGILDAVEGSGDLDADGEVDANDVDDDGDGIPDSVEMGGDPSTPVDSDGDLTPDYLDLDSDADGVLDADEGGDDYDGDGTPNYLDLDADGDGILDLEDGATDVDGDGRPNFLDTDSDNDGIADPSDPNRNDRDTDGDGYTDLAEQTIGTSPTNAGSQPGSDVFYAELTTRSDTAVVVPFTPEIRYGDVLFVLDTTCSMGGVLSTMSNYFSQAVTQASALIPDLTYGVATFNDYNYSGYGSGSDKPFWLKQQQTTNTSQVQSTLSGLTYFGGADGPESSMEAIYQAATGYGFDQDCDNGYDSGDDVYPFRNTGADAFGGSVSGVYNAAVPGTGNLGGSGFRSGAVPIIVVTTDNEMRDADAGSVPPSCSTPAGLSGTASALNALGAKLIGIGTTGLPISKMTSLANLTGSTADLNGDGLPDPLVFQTTASDVVTRLVEGITALTNSVTYDLSLDVDDPSGYGFVTSIDPPVHTAVAAGTPVDFTLTVSTAVTPTESDQVFVLQLTVLGNGSVVLDELTLLLVVLGI